MHSLARLASSSLASPDTQELVADAARDNDVKTVTKEVAAVFSNSEALNRSFLQSGTQRQQAAPRAQIAHAQHEGKWQ